MIDKNYLLSKCITFLCRSNNTVKCNYPVYNEYSISSFSCCDKEKKIVYLDS